MKYPVIPPNTLRIIVAEYPKSGASWFTSLLANSLSIPARDIYVNNDFKLFDISKHPWYEGDEHYGLTESCVIKSHEKPDSVLHNMDAHVIHMIRDGRDVVVSKYFFEKDFCLKNRIIDKFEHSFTDFLTQTAKEWADYITSWQQTGTLTYKYEHLLYDTTQVLIDVLSSLNLNIDQDKIACAIESNTKEKFSKSLSKTFKHNTFVRKGISGDWRNHFSKQHNKIFKELAGDLLVSLGYEKDLSW